MIMEFMLQFVNYMFCVSNGLAVHFHTKKLPVKRGNSACLRWNILWRVFNWRILYQGCLKVKKFGGASSKGWAESAPSGWSRVNWSAKNWGAGGVNCHPCHPPSGIPVMYLISEGLITFKGWFIYFSQKFFCTMGHRNICTKALLKKFLCPIVQANFCEK